MKKVKVFFLKQKTILIVIFFINQMYARSACVIIHGTWAQNETWYKSDGIFFKSVQRTNQELGLVDEVISFSWSGKLSYHCQNLAAQELVENMTSFDELILIGHSHGATVAMIASQIWGKMQSIGIKVPKVKKFYALGVPIESDDGMMPDMQVVECCINLFSFGDYIQTVNGAFKRTFFEHKRIANLAVLVNDLHPSHAALHDAVIGKDLLKIPEFFQSRNLGNFQDFDYLNPGQIKFFDYDLPYYSLQIDQKSLLELDKKAQRMMTLAFFRNKH